MEGRGVGGRAAPDASPLAERGGRLGGFAVEHEVGSPLPRFVNSLLGRS